MAASTLVRSIQPHEVEELWPRLQPLIERGLRFADGCFASGDVKRSLIEGKRQLWVEWPEMRCALITERIDYPLKRVLHVFLAAGRLPRDWRNLWRGIQRLAPSEGLPGIEIPGPHGLAAPLHGHPGSGDLPRP